MPDFAPLVSANKNRPKEFQPLSSKVPSLPAGERQMAAGHPSSDSRSDGKAKLNPNDNSGFQEKKSEKDPKQLEVSGLCQEKKPVITLHRRASNPDEVTGMRIVCGCGEVMDVSFDFSEGQGLSRDMVSQPENPTAPNSVHPAPSTPMG